MTMSVCATIDGLALSTTGETFKNGWDIYFPHNEALSFAGAFDILYQYTIRGRSVIATPFCLFKVNSIEEMTRLMTKPTKWHVRPAKTQISLGIRPVWSESSLSAWRKLGSLATHWARSEDYDHIGRMPRLIWVFAGRTVILLVLSWGQLKWLQAIVTVDRVSIMRVDKVSISSHSFFFSFLFFYIYTYNLQGTIATY